MTTFSLTRFAASLVLIGGLAACGTTGNSRLAEFPLSADPLPGKFVWHDLITDDREATKRFYGGLFGWTFEDTVHPRGGDYTLILAQGHYVGGIVQLDDPQGGDYSRWLGYLSVSDVDNAVETTRSAGGEAVAGPLDLPDIGRAAAITDPQGAVVGLIRSTHGDPDDSVSAAAGHIVWNELLAADDRSAADFYASITGAQANTIERRGGEYTFLRAQNRDRAGIMQRPAPEVEPFWLTHFAVTDLAYAARRAGELGGEVLLQPAADLRDGTLAVIVDPAGAILALHQLTDGG